MVARSISLNTGATTEHIRASSMQDTSSAGYAVIYIVLVWIFIQLCASALLYREPRHFTWHLASCAIIYFPLSLANSRLSSSFRTHFMTLASSSNVETLCRISPYPPVRHKRNTCQMKVVVGLHSDGCTSLGHLHCAHSRFTSSRLETVGFCYIRLCGARMSHECHHHRPVWRDL